MLNEDLSIDTTENKEGFNENMLSIANEFKSLITKMESEITDVKSPVVHAFFLLSD